MTDNLPLVERLRETARAISQYEPQASDSMGALCIEAAALIEQLVSALEESLSRLSMIANFGDPSEIANEPEEWGGTDDGLETVCMAYENMQSIASAGLATCDAALSQARGEQP